MTPEIRAFEYALGLVTVLVGLAIAAIAMSIDRLVRNRKFVIWDPLALLAAAFALCMAVGMWFDMWAERDVSEARNFLFYLSVVAQLFVLFLAATASLPDEAGGSSDLKAYYSGNQRYFWSLVALYWFGYLCHGIYFVSDSMSHLPPLMTALQMAVPFVVALLLVAVKSRRVHYGGLALLFAWVLYYYGPSSIN